MSNKHVYFAMLIVIILLLVGLVGFTYEINSVLASKSNKLVSLKAQSQALGIEQTSLSRAKKDIQKYSGLEQIAQAIVPQDKNQAEAVREIVNIAANSGISLGSVTFPASTLGATSSGIPVANSNISSKTIALSQLKPVVGIPGVYQLDITITSDSTQPVKFNQFIGFLQGLEQNRRTAQVSAVTINPNPQNNSLLTFTLTLEEYIKPS